MKSARNIAANVQQGNGAVHALLYDEAIAGSLQTLMTNASSAADRADVAVGHAENIIAQLENGGPSSPALMKELSTSMESVNRAVDEVSSLMGAAQDPKAPINQLGGDERKEMMADLDAASANLKVVVDKVSNGEGTLGAMLKDPSVMEDLKSILGNVKRNRVLRELVRYSTIVRESDAGTASPQLKLLK